MKLFATAAVMALLSACSPSADPAAEKSAGNTLEAADAPAELTAPAGDYKLDPEHSTLMFRVNHLGVSNYVARFKEFDGTLTLDPARVAASTVTLTVKPASIETDHKPESYKAGHADSPYASWNDDLARSPQFFNASKFPEASFRSTSVEVTGPSTARVTGQLTLLGQTHPLTLDAKLIGATKHPFSGAGVVGITATGSFNRSQYGMNHLLQPPLVGDKVTLELNGEFAQVVPAATPAN